MDARSQQGLRVRLVDDTENRPNRGCTVSGVATDAWPGEVLFTSLVKVIEVRSETQDLEVRLISEDGTVNDSFIVTADSFRSKDFVARGFEVKNRTPGLAATFEVVGDYVEA